MSYAPGAPEQVFALVTGGRDFWPTSISQADLVTAMAGVLVVIEGEADGFDAWVRDQARERGLDVQPVPALWRTAKILLGNGYRREGPCRNARALKLGTALAAEFGVRLVLIAGPGGVGTANMRARCKHLETREVSR